MLYKRPPPIQHLRTIGCLCFVHEQKHGGDKFASCSRRSIFLGYPFGKKGWRVYDLDSRKISVSRDVIFREEEFPFVDHENIETEESGLLIPTVQPTAPLDEVELNQSLPPEVEVDSATDPILPTAEVIETELLLEEVIGTDPDPEFVMTELDGTDMVDNNNEVEVIDHGDLLHDSVVEEAPPTIEPLGRGHRPKIKSTRLKDFVANTIHETSCYPIEDFLSCDRFSSEHRCFLASVTKNDVLRHYSQAVEDPNFREAMKHEIVALEDSGTWTVVDLPPGKKALGCRWVYVIKYRADGTIERHKARLVVFGNHQVEGEDFTETFAPVAKMTTIRCFLEIVMAQDWEVHQMDVHNAFLHGDLDVEVYMRLPPGFRVEDKNKVCRLHKSLYGLKQAPRCWFAKLTGALTEYGFIQSIPDYSLFVFDQDGIQIYVLIYVDDLIITGSSPEMI